MSPKFSIIIPVYNVAPYLRECLDSVLAQTFTDWEAICVDDGSTDGSADILDEYAAKDERFRIVHQPNAGVSAVRNEGMCQAKGEYLTFLDGDDVYDKDWLSNADKVLRETDADLLRNRCVYYRTGELLPSPLEDPEHRVFDGREAIDRWGWDTFTKEGWSWLNFIRRKVLTDDNRFPVGMKFCEDNIFMLKLLPAVCRAVQSEFNGYHYRVREDSVCAGRLPSAYLIRIFDEISLFQDEVKFAHVPSISGFLSRSVMNWRMFRVRNEQGADEAVIAKIRESKASGVLRLQHLSLKVCCGFFAIVALNTFFVLDFLLWLRQEWGLVRNRMRR